MSERPACTKMFKLNNGEQMPAVGLGTWQGSFGSEDEKALEESIVHAIQSGYRLIDTAQHYAVEHIVGRAIRNSGVPRSEIFVVTKFWGHFHHDPEEALRISLQDLGLDYVDLLLMHWPWATTPAPEKRPLRPTESPTIVETWKKMEKLVGPKCKAIGVSNFTQKTLEELISQTSVIPAVNQVELHAFNPNLKLVPYCESKEIVVMSWSTLGGARAGEVSQVLTDDLFTDIAAKHKCSAGVVSLSWAVQRGIVVIPKSGSKKRIEENIQLVDLTEDEVEKINNAHKTIQKYRIADSIQGLHMEIDGKETLQGWTKVDFGWEDEEGNWLV